MRPRTRTLLLALVLLCRSDGIPDVLQYDLSRTQSVDDNEVFPISIQQRDIMDHENPPGPLAGMPGQALRLAPCLTISTPDDAPSGKTAVSLCYVFMSLRC